METRTGELDIVGCGSLSMEYTYIVDRVVRNGFGFVENSRMSPTGSSSNTIYGLAKLGLKTGFVGVVGDDNCGEDIVRDLRSVDVDTTRIRTKSMTQSGSIVNVLDDKGNRSIYVAAGANDLLSWADVELKYACNARYLHLSPFGSRKQLALQLDMAECPQQHMRISMAPGMTYARLGLGTLAPLLRRTHVLFISRQQLQALTGVDTEAGARICHAQGVDTVVVVSSSRVPFEGKAATAYILSDEESVYIPTSPLESPLARDSRLVNNFAIGFLFGLIKGQSLRACGEIGDVIARMSITGIGARDGLPSLTELERRYPGVAT